MEEVHRDEEAYRQSLFEMQTHTRLYDEIFDFDH